MKFPFNFQIRFVRFFWCIVIAYAPRFSIYGNACSPFVLEFYDAHKTRFVSFIGFTDVLRISVFKNFAQVCKSIVRFLTVYVVYKFNRPFTGHVKPRQPMRAVNAFVYSDSRIADAFLYAPRNVTNANTLGHSDFPCKNTGVRVVIKYFTQAVVRKVRHMRLLCAYSFREITSPSSFCKGLC